MGIWNNLRRESCAPLSPMKHHWRGKEEPHQWENILRISSDFRRFPSTILVLRKGEDIPSPAWGPSDTLVPESLKHEIMANSVTGSIMSRHRSVKTTRTRVSFTLFSTRKEGAGFPHSKLHSVVWNAFQQIPVFRRPEITAEMTLALAQHFCMSRSPSVNKWRRGWPISSDQEGLAKNEMRFHDETPYKSLLFKRLVEM